MTIRWKCFVVPLVAAGMAVSASAQPGAPRRGGEGRPGDGPRGGAPSGERRGPNHYAEGFLRRYDRNQDEKVSFDEFRVARKMENMSDEGKRRIFDHLDKNGDGKIVRAELPGMGPGPGGPHLMDADRDGRVSFEEFAASKWMRKVSPEARRDYFDRLDLNKDGFLTPEDVRNRPPGSRPWDRRRPLDDPKALKRLDKNEDGALSFEEWRDSPRFRTFPDDRLREWFNRMDRNDDGLLNEADRPQGPRPDRPGPRPPERDEPR